MAGGTTCSCGGTAVTLLYVCSGASNLGAIADQAGRALGRHEKVRLGCLAAIGAGIPMYLDAARGAESIAAIDGCEKDCARTLLEQKGFAEVRHLRLTNLGMVKGETPVVRSHVDAVVERMETVLRDVGCQERLTGKELE
ncbi:MAG: putative zinc-binding protein [Pseudomonadota bacterium]